MKPDSHLLISVSTPQECERPLVAALLRLDLGARISVDNAKGHVRVEGRFLPADAVRAIEALGVAVRAFASQPPRSALRPVAAW